ncbi:hypothetical protein B9G98_02130 [Wickerhamiella sorbophila]|uniref:Signal sequence receptor subunit alpha n=1 Tax=Wickerhamiella sorbophila TaxID=45607 RepID=A0A2T0FHP6_9ASCO|nr:hypothetical protein B9G98_02130 [Wickerhamiella sorbophila]PRT54510.1 hypothetical protein B9G98_02130 [Wickerhamiella sorbophila]
MKLAALLMAAVAAAQTLVVEPEVRIENGVIVNNNPYEVKLVLKNHHGEPVTVDKVVESWREVGKTYRKTQANRTVTTGLTVNPHDQTELVLSRQQSLPARALDLIYDVQYSVQDEHLSSASEAQTFKIEDPSISIVDPRFISALFFLVTFVGIIVYFSLAILEHPLVTKPVKKERSTTPKREPTPTSTEDWIPQRHLRSRTRAAQE